MNVTVVARCATRYTGITDDSFVPSQRLLRFFQSGSTAGIQPSHAKRVQMILAALNTACTVDDMRTERFRLHALKGAAQGRWSVRVNGNWRITFEFHESHADVLDYEDYH